MSRSLSTAGGSTPNWQKYANNPIVRRVENLVGTGHHSLFTDKEGRLRIVFHAHHSESVVAPRRMYIGTMEFQGNTLRMTADPIIRPTSPGKVAAGIEAHPYSSQREGTTGGRFSWHGWTYDLLGRRVAL